MSISCACDAGDDFEWYYTHKHDFSRLETKRRRRCYSCRTLIDVGSDVGILSRYRAPNSDIEERIHGDEVPMADLHLCEECYGLMLSIEEAGGCVILEKGENLKDAILEWRGEYPNGCREG